MYDSMLFQNIAQIAIRDIIINFLKNYRTQSTQHTANKKPQECGALYSYRLFWPA